MVVARRRLVVSVVAAALIGAPSALATPGTPVAGYGGQGGQAQGALGSQQGDTLPFTGAQAGLAVIGGVILLGSGFALRRAARPDA